MQRSILNWLACAGLAVGLCLGPALWQTAYADDDEAKPGLVVTEVLVTFDDIDNDLKDTILITVEGVDLDTAEAVSVSLGEQGELTVLSAGGGEILALCPAPDSICGEGDFLLTVSVQPALGVDDDDEENAALTAAYGLTIGAVGPQGEQGEQGPQGEPGEPGEAGTNVRVASFFEDGTNSCQYRAQTTSTVSFPRGSCSCSTPVIGDCSCTVTRSGGVSDTENSCTTGGLSVGCPNVGGNQGQSELASCSGDGLASGDSCSFGARTLTGPTSSCSSSVSSSCSCSCFSGIGIPCSCECTPPSRTASCTGPTRTVTRTEQAICLKTEPAT